MFDFPQLQTWSLILRTSEFIWGRAPFLVGIKRQRFRNEPRRYTLDPGRERARGVSLPLTPYISAVRLRPCSCAFLASSFGQNRPRI